MNHLEREERGDEPVLNLQGCVCSVLKSVTLQLSLCSSTQNLSATSDLFTSSTEVLLLGEDTASWGRYTLGKLLGEDTPLGSFLGKIHSCAQRMPKGSGIANVFRQSQSVRETGGSGRNWIKPNAPEAGLRAMDVELQKSKSTKHRKISTMNLQKLKERLGRAVSKFILYNRISFNAVDSEYTQPMLDVAAEVGPRVKGLSAYEVSEVYLGMEYDEMTEWIGSFKGIWAERGVSIMCDGWGSLTRQHIINFLVYCNRDLHATATNQKYNTRWVNTQYPMTRTPIAA
ncbi:unnamed protein product [Camellia sinensis]